MLLFVKRTWQYIHMPADSHLAELGFPSLCTCARLSTEFPRAPHHNHKPRNQSEPSTAEFRHPNEYFLMVTKDCILFQTDDFPQSSRFE
jgi:hypothetical protein